MNNQDTDSIKEENDIPEEDLHRLYWDLIRLQLPFVIIRLTE